MGIAADCRPLATAETTSESDLTDLNLALQARAHWPKCRLVIQLLTMRLFTV